MVVVVVVISAHGRQINRGLDEAWIPLRPGGHTGLVWCGGCLLYECQFPGLMLMLPPPLLLLRSAAVSLAKTVTRRHWARAGRGWGGGRKAGGRRRGFEWNC